MDEKIINLSCKDIKIRLLHVEDLKFRVQWYNDPKVRETLILDKPLELDKTIEWFRSMKDSKERLDMVIETANGTPIGVVGLREINDKLKSAGIYMVLGDKAYWGKSIMYDVHLCLLNYAFQSMHLNKVWANVLSNNIASYVTLKKVGFTREKTLKNEYLRDAQYYDIYRMAILIDDFYQRHPELKFK